MENSILGREILTSDWSMSERTAEEVKKQILPYIQIRYFFVKGFFLLFPATL
jgi:hypothetical protein